MANFWKKDFSNETPWAQNYSNVKLDARFGFYVENNIFLHHVAFEILTLKKNTAHPNVA